MTRKSGILSLGTRADASTWEKGCKALGFSVPSPIKKPSPTMKELRGFFKSQPHWIFFGGHFSGMELYNEDDSVSVTFKEKSVKLRVDKTTATLKAGKAEFDLKKNARWSCGEVVACVPVRQRYERCVIYSARIYFSASRD